VCGNHDTLCFLSHHNAERNKYLWFSAFYIYIVERQNIKTLSASAVVLASSSIVLRRALSINSASLMPRASMHVPYKSTIPLLLNTRFSIRSML